MELRLPEDTRKWPVQRAMKGFKNGPEDGIAAWGKRRRASGRTGAPAESNFLLTVRSVGTTHEIIVNPAIHAAFLDSAVHGYT